MGIYSGPWNARRKDRTFGAAENLVGMTAFIDGVYFYGEFGVSTGRGFVPINGYDDPFKLSIENNKLRVDPGLYYSESRSAGFPPDIRGRDEICVGILHEPVYYDINMPSDVGQLVVSIHVSHYAEDDPDIPERLTLFRNIDIAITTMADIPPYTPDTTEMSSLNVLGLIVRTGPTSYGISPFGSKEPLYSRPLETFTDSFNPANTVKIESLPTASDEEQSWDIYVPYLRRDKGEAYATPPATKVYLSADFDPNATMILDVKLKRAWPASLWLPVYIGGMKSPYIQQDDKGRYIEIYLYSSSNIYEVYMDQYYNCQFVIYYV